MMQNIDMSDKDDDKDIIERLEAQANKQGYIKALVREDITMDIFRNGVENGIIKVL